MRNKTADFVIDLAYGDSGKGKVSHYLLGTGDFTHCVRGGGGMNCGHSVYHNGKKFITHSIPAGVFWNVISVIGPGCVLHPKSLEKELDYLEENGVPARSLVKVAKNVHIITDSHLEEDGKDTKIGTTRKGNGPAYRDKYDRIGIRAENCPELQPYLIDFYEEVLKKDFVILYEGAQGFGLDIDHGDYPYVTSSHTTVAGALLNGISHTSVRSVFGVIKAYNTYVGAKHFQPNDEIFNKIRELGGEYGATTGRPRQCYWNDIRDLEKASAMNGITDLIVNKMDILQQIGVWKMVDYSGEEKDFGNEAGFKEYVENFCRENEIKVKFSYSPERI